jgi:peptidoglycan/LPS O-acetylase OafA/YrhL
MLLLNQWRLELLFAISGLAVHFLLGKLGPGAFARARIKRLLVPLLFGMAVVVPPQAWFQALSNGSFNGGYGQFLWQYFTFQPWPRDAFDGSAYGFTWNHLWYLPYLIFFTLAFLPLCVWLNRGGAPLLARMRRLRGLWLVLAPVLPMFFCGLVIFPLFPDQTHALYNDWYWNALYGLCFFYGFVIGRDTALWAEIGRLRRRTLALAILTFASYLTLGDVLAYDGATATQNAAFMFVLYLNRWAWILVALGWGYAYLNRPSKLLTYANEAVYPWYILHQTVIVVAGYELSKLALGPVLEPVALLAITIGATWMLHEFVIRRTRWLRPLFGLKAMRKAQAPTVPVRVAAEDVQ